MEWVEFTIPITHADGDNSSIYPGIERQIVQNRWGVSWNGKQWKEEGEAGQDRSQKALWSMLMKSLFRTLGSCHRTLLRVVTESDGIWETALWLMVRRKGYKVRNQTDTKQDDRDGQAWGSFRKYNSQHLGLNGYVKREREDSSWCPRFYSGWLHSGWRAVPIAKAGDPGGADLGIGTCVMSLVG